MKKRVIAVVAAVTLTLSVQVGSALAHECLPANKPIGAVSAGTLYLSGEDELLGIDAKMNPTGRVTGGFLTVDIEGIVVGDTFAQTTLPEVAQRSGPGGDSLCDGKGVDNGPACFPGG